jgi:hypothetical protein
MQLELPALRLTVVSWRRDCIRGLLSTAKLLAEGKLLASVLIKLHLNFIDVPVWADVNNPDSGIALVNVFCIAR